MSYASERQAFEPTSQWCFEYLRGCVEGGWPILILLIFLKNSVGLQCRHKSFSLLFLNAGHLAAGRWENSRALSLAWWRHEDPCCLQFSNVGSPEKCPKPPVPSLLSCLAFLQAAKHWGIVGLSFFLSFTWRWVFALRALRKRYNMAGGKKQKKENLVRVCLLKWSTSVAPSLLSSLPPSLLDLCSLSQLLVEKAESLFLISSHAFSPPSLSTLSLSLAIGYFWGIITVITSRKLIKKKNATTVSNNRIIVALFKYYSLSVQYFLFVPGYCRHTH